MAVYPVSLYQEEPSLRCWRLAPSIIQVSDQNIIETLATGLTPARAQPPGTYPAPALCVRSLAPLPLSFHL